MNYGIIYYNIGFKCIVRLAVSLYSLRNVYDGNICIIACGDSYNHLKRIAKQFNCSIIEANFPKEKKHNAFLNKCRINYVTPFKKTLLIDADTIVLNNPAILLHELDYHEAVFTQFADWKTSSKKIKKRVDGFKKACIKLNIDIEKTYENKYAVNTGVYAFRKNAKIFEKWFYLALENCEQFIPDEIACQILIPHYNHKIVSSEWNTSCKHDKKFEKGKIIHYHGSKHCRIEGGEYKYHSDLWYLHLKEARKLMALDNYIEYDRQLRNNINKCDII